MIKHKIIYTFIAFDNIEQIQKKIELLYTKEDFFIVHWNKLSSKEKLSTLKQQYADVSNVYIYSKYKVEWGMNNILLVLLENMKLAIQMASPFEHLFVLSEQCMPVKTSAYIKSFLSRYRNKSLLGFRHMPPPPGGPTEYISDYYRMTRHFYTFCHSRYKTFFTSLKSRLIALGDVLSNLGPIIRDIPNIKERYLSQLRQGLKGRKLLWHKFKLVIKYIFFSPGRLFNAMLCGRDYMIGNYGKNIHKDFNLPDNELLVTFDSGPAGCYCYDHCVYLSTEKNIHYVKKVLFCYFAAEEWYCESMLYADPVQRSKIVNQSVCFWLAPRENINLHGLIDKEFFDPQELIGRMIDRDVSFEQVLFVRKINTPDAFAYIENHLNSVT